MHSEHTPLHDLGSRIFGLGAIVFGATGLAWGDFAFNWVPVQPDVPHRVLLAYVTAILLILGGLGVLWRRTAQAGAVILGVLYVIFALLWLPRVIGFPQIYGTWGGLLEELAPAPAALIVYAMCSRGDPARRERLAQLGRYVFGVCVLSFAAEHFTALPQTAEMVPAWIPPGQRFWAIATGLFFVLAGVVIISGVMATLGARLLTAMFVGFSLLIWFPRLFALPHAHNVWAGNAVNLTMAGAAWVVADWLARRDRYAGAPDRE